MKYLILCNNFTLYSKIFTSIKTNTFDVIIFLTTHTIYILILLFIINYNYFIIYLNIIYYL